MSKSIWLPHYNLETLVKLSSWRTASIWIGRVSPDLVHTRNQCVVPELSMYGTRVRMGEVVDGKGETDNTNTADWNVTSSFFSSQMCSRSEYSRAYYFYLVLLRASVLEFVWTQYQLKEYKSIQIHQYHNIVEHLEWKTTNLFWQFLFQLWLSNCCDFDNYFIVLNTTSDRSK